MDRRGDLAMAVAVVAFSAIMLYFTSVQNPGPTFDPIGKQGLPYATFGFMLVSGLVLVAKRLRTWRLEPSNIVYAEGSDDEEGHPASFRRAAAVMGLTIGFALVMAPLGFLLAAPLYIIVALLVMNVRTWWMLTLVPIGFTIVIFFVFNNLLSVPLPAGPLTDILVNLGWIDRVR